MPEKKVAISKVEDGKYLAQCWLCGTWLEVHPVIGPEMTIKFWQADFTCCETNQTAFFFTIFLYKTEPRLAPGWWRSRKLCALGPQLNHGGIGHVEAGYFI